MVIDPPYYTGLPVFQAESHVGWSEPSDFCPQIVHRRGPSWTEWMLLIMQKNAREALSPYLCYVVV